MELTCVFDYEFGTRIKCLKDKNTRDVLNAVSAEQVRYGCVVCCFRLGTGTRYICNVHSYNTHYIALHCTTGNIKVLGKDKLMKIKFIS